MYAVINPLNKQQEGKQAPQTRQQQEGKHAPFILVTTPPKGEPESKVKKIDSSLTKHKSQQCLS